MKTTILNKNFWDISIKAAYFTCTQLEQINIATTSVEMTPHPPPPQQCCAMGNWGGGVSEEFLAHY